MNLKQLSGAAVMAATVAWTALAQTPMREGRWEVKMTIDVPNMPFKMPAIKTTQCMTKEDLADPNKSVPKGKDKDCQVSDYRVDGNKATWNVKCGGKDPTTGRGEITYAADSYEGWMKTHSKDADTTMKYTAKRLGDCTK